jgi:hypothetical protein
VARYRQLDLSERRRLYQMTITGCSEQQSVADLGQHVSTIYRELKRNFGTRFVDTTPRCHRKSRAPSMGSTHDQSPMGMPRLGRCTRTLPRRVTTARLNRPIGAAHAIVAAAPWVGSANRAAISVQAAPMAIWAAP